MTPAAIVDEIEALFAAKGGESYGEAVTMFEHCLLTARTAREAGAPDPLVAACLLHDIGHLLVPPDDAYGKHAHDAIGAAWLEDRFPAAVVEPVRHHVAAKRYLCAVEPDYHAGLSAASQYTLRQQGGPMSAAEAEEFEHLAFAADAVQLRRWEDGFAKQDHGTVPEFSEFRQLLTALADPEASAP